MSEHSEPTFGPLIRICFVSIIFLINFCTIFHLLFRRKTSMCSVHSTTYGLSIIIINAFISTWIPYLFSSYVYETAWPLIKLDVHCLIQQSIPLMISTILLIVFCFEKIFETFISQRAKLICLFIFFIWILPQCIYLMFQHLTWPKNNHYYFMDGMSTNETRHNRGVLFCIDKLDSWNVRQMTWHYVTIVVPMTSLYIICTAAKRFSTSSFPGQLLNNVNCNCPFDVIMFICHYSNFTWLLLFRPLLTLSSLILAGKNHEHQDDYETSLTTHQVRSLTVDLGSHFMLLFISILLPFSHQFGLLSSKITQSKTYQIKSTHL